MKITATDFEKLGFLLRQVPPNSKLSKKKEKLDVWPQYAHTPNLIETCSFV